MPDTFKFHRISYGIRTFVLLLPLLFVTGVDAEEDSTARIKELTEEVDRLKAKVEELKKENDKLRTRADGRDFSKVAGKVKEYIGMLKGNSSQRFKARQELIKIGRPAVPALIEATKADHPFVKQTSIQTLGDIGEKSAVPALLEVLVAGNTELAANANRALGKVTRQYFGIIGLDESEAERKEVIEKWNTWWEENKDK